MPDNDKRSDFDVADFGNHAIARLDGLTAQFEMVGKILGEMKKAQEKHIHKEPRRITPNNTVSFNFRVMSIYVDNSQEAQPITLTDEQGISFTIPANTQQWIHPLGSSYFDISGTGNGCPAIFVDEFVPIK